MDEEIIWFVSPNEYLKLQASDGEPLEGTYAKALCPDMAVYPEDI